MAKVRLYSDGSSRGNPGPGGYGTVLSYTTKDNKLHEKEFSQGYKNTTNNRMELMGVIRGLEELKFPCEVDIYTDSSYVVKAFNEKWIDSWIKADWRRNKKNPVKNIDLWERLLKAMKPHKCTYHWVKGHAGHDYNERCDDLAVAAAEGSNLPEDNGYS